MIVLLGEGRQRLPTGGSDPATTLEVTWATTTARFRPVEGATELRLEMDYRVAGGPIGRLFDARVGNEMVTTVGGDLARLKALAEEQAGHRQV